MLKNSEKRFVYLLKMNFLGKDYFKVGVFTGYVASRISKILRKGGSWKILDQRRKLGSAVPTYICKCRYKSRESGV